MIANQLKPQKKKAGLSPLVTVLLIAPAVILFFFGGIYVGSQFVHEHTEEESVGLPGTNNIIRRWSNQHLRGFDITKLAPPLLQHHMRANVPEPTGAAHIVEEAKPNAAINPEDAPQLGAVKPLAPVDFSGSGGVPHLDAAAHLVTGSEMAKYLTSSLHVGDKSYMAATADLDAKDIIVGAWVYLENVAGENDMRTIFTNKAAGCDPDQERYGFSMYVNAWQTNNHQLYVEYGGINSGCNKLDSKGIQLLPARWYHVALAFLERTVTLFIDGSIVNEMEDADTHEINTGLRLQVGHFQGEGFPLHGNVSHLAVVHTNPGESVNDIVRFIMNVEKVQSIPGLVALYPLKDAVAEVHNSVAKDVIGGHNGMYVFPAKKTTTAGVPFKLVDGVDGRLPTTDEVKQSEELGRVRMLKIRDGMKHAWAGYKKYAWGQDELKPKSKTGQDNWGGMGVTLVDSLDTLYLMGMEEEFKEAKEWVEKSLTFDHAGTVSVFETTIRELGGLLSAYDLSGEEIFLTKAKELGNKLLPAFNTNTGIPSSQVNFRSGQAADGWSGGTAILSELGTLQVEFRYLSYMTEEKKYEEKSMKVMQRMNALKPKNGLYPIKVSTTTGKFADNMVTFGALGDSFYEYLLKIWIQGGRREDWLREMYDNAIDGVVDVLLKASEPSGLAYISDWDGYRNHNKMDHLVCFMPGTLALGSYTDPRGSDSPRAKRDLAIARALMYTCREMYHRTKSGIAPEYVEFVEGRDMVPAANANFYILRPETAESLFILNQVTEEPIYREWAWEIWEAIEKHCRTEVGYGALKNVDHPEHGVDDRMESFFLAETMKYLYLVQNPEQPINLLFYVFNTEAHPTHIFESHFHEPFPAS
eukprot:gene2517-4896_t